LSHARRCRSASPKLCCSAAAAAAAQLLLRMLQQPCGMLSARSKHMQLLATTIHHAFRFPHVHRALPPHVLRVSAAFRRAAAAYADGCE